MGNSPVDCCQDPKPSGHEFVSIVPARMHAIAALQHNLAAIRHSICRTSFLSELDFYLLRLRHNPEYARSFTSEFGSSEELLDAIGYEEGGNWVVPLQAKTYDLRSSRFNEVDCIAFPLEFGVVAVEGQGQGPAAMLRSNLRKAEWLLLERSFGSYEEEEFIGLLVGSLRGWAGDYGWALERKGSYEEMSRHLHYRLGWLLPFVNSELSLNDAASWARARYLFQYLLHRLALAPPALEPAYFLDNWVHEAEAALLAPGQVITLHNFACFAPFSEEQNYNEEDTVRLNPPRGEEDSPRVKLRVVVQPSVRAPPSVKFRNYEYLYYLPFTIFRIESIEQKYGLVYLYIQEMEAQTILDYLRDRTRPAGQRLSKGEAKRMVSELAAFRDGYSTKLEEQFDPEVKEVDPLSLAYYQRYIKNRVNVLISEQQLPLLSKKELEICEQEVKVKLDEEVTHEERDSEVREAQVSPQERAALERELHRYIKKHDFEKLQSQIDSVDVFINITSLNISQCWLQRLECLHCFPNLTELFAYSNLIKKIEGLQSNPSLRLLSLARNEIELLENMDHLVHLRELYLTKNKLELASAVYLSRLSLPKLKMLTISFKAQVDECFEALLHRPPPRLKQLLINEGDLLAQRTKNSLKRRLKGVEIQYIHG